MPDAIEAPGEASGLAGLFGEPAARASAWTSTPCSSRPPRCSSRWPRSRSGPAQTVVEGVAGGGVVKVTVTAAMDFQSITISPDAVDPDDVEMLQDLVLAALHDAVDQVQELQSGALGGVDMGGLGGLLGQ